MLVCGACCIACGKATTSTDYARQATRLLVAEGVQDGASDLQQRGGRHSMQVPHCELHSDGHAPALHLHRNAAADGGVEGRLQG